MLKSLCCLPLAIACGLSPVTAQAFHGIDSATGDLYDIDASTNTATLLGPVTGGSPFGFGSIAASSEGTLYAVAPGLLRGFTIYEIDPLTLVATQLHAISSGSAGIAMAVDPSGNSIWVAGFRQLSLIVDVSEVDLATGVVTSRGAAGGNLWGLAFDAAGDLYSAVQGSSSAELIRIDKTNAANSTVVGPMAGVDFSMGLSLSSDLGSGAIHVFSRNADTIHSVDTTSGAATLVSILTGASSIFNFTEKGCQLVQRYGTSCAGTGGFAPKFSVGGCPAPGGTISLDFTDGLGGTGGLLLFGVGQAAVPLGGGCEFALSILLPPNFPFALGGNGAGAGSASLPVPLPSYLSPGSFTMQALFVDAANPLLVTFTNGVEITFP